MRGIKCFKPDEVRGGSKPSKNPIFWRKEAIIFEKKSQIIKNPFNKRLQNIPLSPHIQFLAPENDF